MPLEPYYHYSNSWIAGTYMVRIGPCFYIGSTTDFGKRTSVHRSDLWAGRHHNKTLQLAWDLFQEVEVTLVDELPRTPDDCDRSHALLLRLYEDALLAEHWGTLDCCNSSASAFFNSRTSINARTPGWRDRQRKKAESRITALRKHNRDYRELVANTSHHQDGRACRIFHKGKTRKFKTTTEAAAYCGVHRVALEEWLNGERKWPTPGSRICLQHRHMAEYRGHYEKIKKPRA